MSGEPDVTWRTAHTPDNVRFDLSPSDFMQNEDKKGHICFDMLFKEISEISSVSLVEAD